MNPERIERGNILFMVVVMVIQLILWLMKPTDNGLPWVVARAAMSGVLMLLYALIGWGIMSLSAYMQGLPKRFAYSKALEVYLWSSLVTVLLTIIDLRLDWRLPAEPWRLVGDGHAGLAQLIETEKCVQLGAFLILTIVWPKLVDRFQTSTSAPAKGVTA